MAKEEKINVVDAVIVSVTKHKVKKEFTLDKLYRIGDSIELPSGKLKEVLISNKFI